MGESRNAYRVLVGRPEEKDLWGPRRRWEDNIKMDLREVGYDDRDWINLAQDRDRWRAYVRAAMNLRFIIRICKTVTAMPRAVLQCTVVAEPSSYTVCVMQCSIIRVIGAFTILSIPVIEPSLPKTFLWPSKVNVNVCSSEKINTFASANISQHTGHWSRSETKKSNNIKLEIWSSIKSRMKLAYNEVQRRNFKIVNVIESEVETTINQFVAYSLALDGSTDRNDKAHLAIFIRGVNEHFTVSECLLDVITKYNWRRSFPGTERHHRTEEVEFAMACVNSNRRAPAS
ncbi:hypothetical protein ANN_24109 [Periplaneta americana]|uniref:Uncharacterized protein n=1 Tax=Periplaneta americana TaxID=6978 RepID=A0ABQ8S2F3_PERAM|nr:hypothetical protein ANN_24109 [Periplaneta americana]